MIIINRRILDIIIKCKSHETIIHTCSWDLLINIILIVLVLRNKLQVRNMTYDLCKSLLGQDHIASIMATY